MATTTNFGWETPDDTDLVKDGAAAIRTALGGVDTSFVDLKGGTTGQVLAKASATDLDFSWVAVDPLTILDAKGDLISATAADTPARLAVGANDTVLTADSSTATGLKWATPASGGMTLLASGTLSGTLVTLSSISGSYKDLVIYVRDFINNGSTNDFLLQVNSSQTTVTAFTSGTATTFASTGYNQHYMNSNTASTQADNHAVITIPDYTSSSVALVQSICYTKVSNTTNTVYFVNSAFTGVTTAVTSVGLSSPSTWGGGTYELYGRK